MTEKFYESISEYSDKTQQVLKDIFEGDKGFHSQAMMSDEPFLGMLEYVEGTYTQTSPSVIVPIGGNGMDVNVRLSKADDEKCWFFTVEANGEEYRGVVRFNTIYNPMGEVSFAFINDNEGDDFDDITMSLPYSSFLMMVK